MNGGVLHYTRMGKNGDQDIHWAQNATLAEAGFNGVDVHLFEVMDAGEYVYCGRIELVDKPYLDEQCGEDGITRKVWMFPIRPVPENDVKKPQMFVFKDMEDYVNRGKNVDAEYVKMMAAAKNNEKKKSQSITKPVIEEPAPKPAVVAPKEIIGKRISHKPFGEGTITQVFDEIIVVQFEEAGTKKLSYELCIRNNMLEFL